MSASTKVGVAPAAGVTSVVGRVATGGRASTLDRIDGASGSSSVGLYGHWRPNFDDGAGQGGGFYFYPQQRDQEQALFTPLVGLCAGAFAASEPIQDNRASSPIFLTDLLRGVGIYEFNMKVFAGGFKSQGSVVNRYG